jgi:hypothetical protein
VPLCCRKPATKDGKAVVPLPTHLRSEEIHSVRPPQRLPSPGTAFLAGAFFWRRPQLLWGAASSGSRPGIASRAAGLRVRCAYTGCFVVVVVVVVAGEAAAWAETITVLTTGLTQRSGKTSGLNEPPPNAACKMRRRSTVMVEGLPLGAFDAPPLRTFAKYSISRFRSSHTPPRGAKRGRSRRSLARPAGRSCLSFRGI